MIEDNEPQGRGEFSDLFTPVQFWGIGAISIVSFLAVFAIVAFA